MKLLTLGLACALVLSSVDADAKRMGGGSSIGRQSGNVTQRQATPPAAPNNAGNAAQAPAQTPAQAQAARPATAGAAAAAPRKPWGAMLGGLAAGLGLAWLANALGFGAEFAQFLMFALLALVIMLVIGLVMRSRRATNGAVAGQGGRPLAFQGAGAAADRAAAPPQYNADKVGNDASARPWERSGGMAFDGSRGASGVQIGSGLAGDSTAVSTWSIPAGFDTEAFVAGAKRNFVTLQDAWDRSDIPSLRAMMTDEMLAEIRAQLAERESHTGGHANKTEVVMLDAQVLGIEDIGADYLASVEFSGMIREEPSSGPTPFREVWNMTKPKNGASGWLVAGVQALQ